MFQLVCCKGGLVLLWPSHASPARDTCTDAHAPADNPDAKPESIVKEGDTVRVRIDKIERDAKTGGEKIRLSMMEKFDVRPCDPCSVPHTRWASQVHPVLR